MDITDRRSAAHDPDAATSHQMSSETPIARTSSHRQFLQYVGGGIGIASLLVATGLVTTEIEVLNA